MPPGTKRRLFSKGRDRVLVHIFTFFYSSNRLLKQSTWCTSSLTSYFKTSVKSRSIRISSFKLIAQDLYNTFYISYVFYELLCKKYSSINTGDRWTLASTSGGLVQQICEAWSNKFTIQFGSLNGLGCTI